ncbi:MAG: thioredoxin-disulfide reductase [Peptococcaceae bacterium]|nr:thioredoxin-disulfide reductase [Peptococcaceae bacterium]
MNIIDLAIIGGGPAGLSAGIYAARADLSAVLFEQLMPGGLAASTETIENYPGFSEGVGGPELALAMVAQAERFGLEIVYAGVKNMTVSDGFFRVTTDDATYKAKAVIISSGAKPKLLGIMGEQRFQGRGVSYCATCDGALFRDKQVAVIGGGDSALEEAIFLAKFASKVFIIHRRKEFRASKYVQQKVANHEKIEFLLERIPVEIKGEKNVESISLKNIVTNEAENLQIDGVFVYVGYTPSVELIKELIELDENGYVITDDNMATNVPGLFVAGDLRRKMLRQVVTAAADGAIAAVSAEKYLEGLD